MERKERIRGQREFVLINIPSHCEVRRITGGIKMRCCENLPWKAGVGEEFPN